MVVKPTTADLPADWRSPSRRLMTMRRYEILAVGLVAGVVVSVAPRTWTTTSPGLPPQWGE